MTKHYSFFTLRDNRPAMESIGGELEEFTVEYPDTTPSIRYTLTVNPDLFPLPKDWHKACFALDDGYSIRLYYVGGYSQDSTKLYIDPVTSSSYRGPSKTYFVVMQGKEETSS